MSDARLMWRKSLNIVMLTLTGVAALAVVSVLFMILGYLIWNGGKALNWGFLRRSFRSRLEKLAEEWPMRSGKFVKLLLLAAVMGLPVGLLAAGSTWPNSAEKPSPLWFAIQRTY